MYRIFINLIIFFMLFAAGNLVAQVSANGLMPVEVDLAARGWRTTLQTGNLTFGMPISSVPGEVPIRVGFGFDATCLAKVWGHPEYDPEHGATRVVQYRMDWPIAAGIHFGYLTDNLCGDTPVSSMPGAPPGPGMVILENGKQIPDSRWTTLSSNPALGTPLNLLQAFGFGPVAPNVARVDSTAAFLLCTTTEAGLAAPCRRLVPGLVPSGFGGQGEHRGAFRVVMDERLARVYCYAGAARAWLPVLWTDRSGHYVTFKWERSAADIPPGFRSITKVTALNQQAQGVVVRWAEPASNTLLSDLCRVDFVGVHASSALIQGYGGSPSQGPAGFALPAQDHLHIVSLTNLGIACRPTTLTIAGYGTLPQPGWADSGSSPAATPAAPPEDGALDPPSQTWRFTYDGNVAELDSITDPMGAVTSFRYSTYCLAATNYVRGVTEVHEIDADRNQRYMRWSRTFPPDSAPMSIKVEGWGDTDKVTPDRFHLITFPTDALNFGNGVPQQDVLMDASGRTWSSTTITWLPTGSGADGTLSRVQAITVASDGAPTCTTTFRYPDPTGLRNIQIDISVADTNGETWTVSSKPKTFAATPWGEVEGLPFVQGDSRPLVSAGFWVYRVVCRGQVAMTTTNEAEAQLELERRREHGTERSGTGVRCEIVRTWVSGVGPMGGQGELTDHSGQAEAQAQANQQKIRDLQRRNDSMKTRTEIQAIRSYLASIGVVTTEGAAFGAISFGEAGAAIGAITGLGIGAGPGAILGVTGGAIVGGVGGLSASAVSGGIELQKTLQKAKCDWEANYKAVQNYSDINCAGSPPEIRY